MQFTQMLEMRPFIVCWKANQIWFEILQLKTKEIWLYQMDKNKNTGMDTFKKIINHSPLNTYDIHWDHLFVSYS